MDRMSRSSSARRPAIRKNLPPSEQLRGLPQRHRGANRRTQRRRAVSQQPHQPGRRDRRRLPIRSTWARSSAASKTSAGCRAPAATLRNTGSPAGIRTAGRRQKTRGKQSVGRRVRVLASRRVQLTCSATGHADSLSNSINMIVFQALGNRADGLLLKDDPTRNH